MGPVGKREFFRQVGKSALEAEPTVCVKARGAEKAGCASNNMAGADGERGGEEKVLNTKLSFGDTIRTPLV